MKCLPFFVCVTVGNGLDRSAKKEKRIATPSSKARNDRPMSLLAKNPYFLKRFPGRQSGNTVPPLRGHHISGKGTF